MGKMQTVTRGSTRGFPALTVYFAEHTPHWTRTGNGWAMATFEVCVRAPGHGWLSIDTTEHNRNMSSKRTMVTLDDDSARALYAFLKSQYEPTNGS